MTELSDRVTYFNRKKLYFRLGMNNKIRWVDQKLYRVFRFGYKMPVTSTTSQIHWTCLWDGRGKMSNLKYKERHLYHPSYIWLGGGG